MGNIYYRLLSTLLQAGNRFKEQFILSSLLPLQPPCGTSSALTPVTAAAGVGGTAGALQHGGCWCWGVRLSPHLR